MKTLLFLSITLSVTLSCYSQSHHLDLCFSKANRKSIDTKMENLLKRVSEETGCERTRLSYTVNDYYTGFYTEKCRHLPKRIAFTGCGEIRTYSHKGLSGAVLYWLLGNWVLEKQ